MVFFGSHCRRNGWIDVQKDEGCFAFLFIFYQRKIYLSLLECKLSSIYFVQLSSGEPIWYVNYSYKITFFCVHRHGNWTRYENFYADRHKYILLKYENDRQTNNIFEILGTTKTKRTHFKKSLGWKESLKQNFIFTLAKYYVFAS